MTMSRNHGLDTLRASAIILVLLYHFKVVVSGTDTFGFLTVIGWTGVDLFFVLSGYLIGDQIFGPLARGEGFGLGTFFARRALRTLPDYLAILLLYWMLFDSLSGSYTAPWWRFISFTQNLGMHPGETFTHSWSLCIEEQFYVILPVVALLLAQARRPGLAGAVVAFAAIGAGMVVRWQAWSSHGGPAINDRDYYEFIYYSSFARFDELLPGVLIALAKHYAPSGFAAVLRHGRALLVAGVAATAGMLVWLSVDSYTFGTTVFGYPLLAASFALLVLAALSTDSPLRYLRVPGAQALALSSYAIYLAHKPIYKLARTGLARLGIDEASVSGIVIILALGVLGGWLLYWAIETPFMRLRARYFPTNRGARSPLATA